MIGVLYATSLEAAPFLEITGATNLGGDGFVCHGFVLNRGGKGVVLVSGMGKANAERGADYLFRNHGVKVMVNPGICGAVSPGIPVGGVFGISEVRDGENPSFGEWSSGLWDWPDLGVARLMTFDKPVFDKTVKENAARFCDLVDMEGVAVVRASRRLGIPSYLIKGVSDFAGDGERDMLQENLHAVSLRIAHMLVGIFDSAVSLGSNLS